MESKILNFSNKTFCVYGLGTTGTSLLRWFKKNNLKNFEAWDDNEALMPFKKRKDVKNSFLKKLDSSDFILISPGINFKKTKLKRHLIRNKHKIITDLDLFYLLNPKVNSIIITGTNGKSTTCKILEHVFKKNKINVELGGNIGRPVLNLSLRKDPVVIIEASSFQLFYSKFIKPKYAAIINLTKDHLEWHGTMSNYINSKLKIFSSQKKNNYSFLNSKFLIKKFKKKKFKGRLNIVNFKNYKKIKNKIQNNYLNLEINNENMSFVYTICKKFKINDQSFTKALKSFKGLPHRHEIFLKRENKIFINDSKATSFEASKYALKNNKNIYWILGGLPKVKDKFKLEAVKKNITKAFIIGKHMKVFEKFLIGKVAYKLSKNLKNALSLIFKEIQKNKKKKITVLFSPASASFDQFKNFEDRGLKFKNLVKSHENKYS